MNKKLIYSLIAGTMFTLTSCDDFLDVQPASGFTPEYIFSSESEMKALMTRIYSSMTEDGLYGSNLASGLNTNTDVEMSSFKNNTVSTNGSDIGCFPSHLVGIERYLEQYLLCYQLCQRLFAGCAGVTIVFR